MTHAGQLPAETGETVMYTLGALLLLAVLIGAVVSVVESVLSAAGVHDTIKKLPVLGAHLGLIISILVMWFLGLKAGNPIAGWWDASDAGVDDWAVYVANGAIVYGMIPLKDAIISMVNKGLRA